MYTDITIKSRCTDPAVVERILQLNLALYKGLDVQTDTFYEVDHGKLKHRQGIIENVLIHYNRINQAGASRTEVLLYLENPDAETIDQKSKGKNILGQLIKQRKIYFIENVKFHIDYLGNAGSFIEIEAIDNDGSLGTELLQEQCDFYKKLLHINDSDLIIESYIELQQNTINQ